MFFKIHNRRAQSPVEYMGIIALLLAALFFFQRYLVQGFLGRWRGTGETWSYGRQFEPDLTTRCAYYEGRQLTNVDVEIWYDADCFDKNCKRNCFSGIADKDQCLSCMNGCSTKTCQDEKSLPPESPVVVSPPPPPELP